MLDLAVIAKAIEESCPGVVADTDRSGLVIIIAPVIGHKWQALWRDGRFHTAPITSVERIVVMRAALDAIERQIDEAS